jgi:hypothetical protein
MDLYALLVFVHVLGAVGLFGGMSIEAVAIRRLLRTRGVDETRTWVGLLREGGRIAMTGMATLLVAGVAMMATRWGPRPWILAALVGVGLMIVVGLALTRRAMTRLESWVSEESARRGTGIPVRTAGSLSVSLLLRFALAIGILGLMTMKPGAFGSILIMGMSFVLGLGVALRPGGQTVGAGPREALESSR